MITNIPTLTPHVRLLRCAIESVGGVGLVLESPHYYPVTQFVLTNCHIRWSVRSLTAFSVCVRFVVSRLFDMLLLSSVKQWLYFVSLSQIIPNIQQVYLWAKNAQLLIIFSLKLQGNFHISLYFVWLWITAWYSCVLPVNDSSSSPPAVVKEPLHVLFVCFTVTPTGSGQLMQAAAPPPGPRPFIWPASSIPPRHGNVGVL